jgi:hypothetical protein
MNMQSASYYREHAARADRLADGLNNTEIVGVLKRLARDYCDIAEDLEAGAIEVLHPSLLPQQQHLE